MLAAEDFLTFKKLMQKRNAALELEAMEYNTHTCHTHTRMHHTHECTHTFMHTHMHTYTYRYTYTHVLRALEKGGVSDMAETDDMDEVHAHT